MKELTIRDLPPELAAALLAEQKRSKSSLDRIVIDLLCRSLNLEVRPSNGLQGLAGSWSDEEHARFEENRAPFDRIDDELWQ